MAVLAMRALLFGISVGALDPIYFHHGDGNNIRVNKTFKNGLHHSGLLLRNLVRVATLWMHSHQYGFWTMVT